MEAETSTGAESSVPSWEAPGPHGQHSPGHRALQASTYSWGLANNTPSYATCRQQDQLRHGSQPGPSRGPRTAAHAHLCCNPLACRPVISPWALHLPVCPASREPCPPTSGWWHLWHVLWGTQAASTQVFLPGGLSTSLSDSLRKLPALCQAPPISSVHYNWGAEEGEAPPSDVASEEALLKAIWPWRLWTNLSGSWSSSWWQQAVPTAPTPGLVSPPCQSATRTGLGTCHCYEDEP